MGITPSVLALTIMAWGNSCGDLMTNVSIARQGLGSMALAGSYGGPIFNLNIGLGLSLCYVCTLRYPEVFELRPDPQAVVSIVFLLCNLTLTVTAVWLRGGILDRKFGFFLIFVYMIYTLVQLVVVIITRDN
jgi:sodium/potassium/calcium exchanger 6